MTNSQRKAKRLFDLVFGVIFLLLSLFLVIPIGLAIKLEDGGSVFSKHLRTGKNSRLFVMYKLRTRRRETTPVLSLEAVAVQGVGRIPEHFCFDKDMQTITSVTRVGRILRRTRLDELPQLWNVLIGNMSLVGPRPELREIADHYDEEQLKRLTVKPGITGLAQVEGSCEMAYGDKISYDRKYVEQYSLLLDLKILLQTFLLPWKKLPQPTSNKKGRFLH